MERGLHNLSQTLDLDSSNCLSAASFMVTDFAAEPITITKKQANIRKIKVFGFVEEPKKGDPPQKHKENKGFSQVGPLVFV